MATLDLIALFSILATLLGYYAYYFLTGTRVFRNMFIAETEGGAPALQLFMATKITGFVTMGLLPALLYVILFHNQLSVIGLGMGDSGKYWYLLAGLPVIAVMVSFMTSRSPETLSRYPELRFSEWTPSRLLLSTLAWILYLFAYEFLFRGLLLFALCYAYGPVISVVINVALYSSFHLPKGAGETLGAILLGLLLCCCALLTSSFFLPFLIHTSLALSTHYFTILHNPDMRIVVRRNPIHP